MKYNVFLLSCLFAFIVSLLSIQTLNYKISQEITNLSVGIDNIDRHAKEVNHERVQKMTSYLLENAKNANGLKQYLSWLILLTTLFAISIFVSLKNVNVLFKLVIVTMFLASQAAHLLLTPV